MNYFFFEKVIVQEIFRKDLLFGNLLINRADEARVCMPHPGKLKFC